MKLVGTVSACSGVFHFICPETGKLAG
jgi:hypothetical protein